MDIPYEYGYVYQLVCSETGDSYYGSTSNPRARYNHHKSKYNQCSSRHLINPIMNILEVKPDITKNQLEYIEKNYILNNPCVNKKIPRRTQKEYYKDTIKENPKYNAERYVKSGGKIRNIRTKKYCECGGKYIQRNLKAHLGSNLHKKYISNT